jgi:hypothetical protein
MVALEHFSTVKFEMLFSQTCLIAKMLGLHKPVQSQDDAAENTAEQRDLFWSLYVIDKQMCLLRGTTPHLLSFDCDVPFPGANPEYPPNPRFLAAIEMAHLQEKTHYSLLSIGASRNSEAARQQNCDVLSANLTAWAATHQYFLSTSATAPIRESVLALELKFSLLACKILINRENGRAESRSQRLVDSRESLAIVKALAGKRSNIDAYIALRRYVSCNILCAIG